jgi:hypothetical protein
MAASQRTSIPAELRSLFPTHFPVGEITYDTRVPEGYEVREPSAKPRLARAPRSR